MPDSPSSEPQPQAPCTLYPFAYERGPYQLRVWVGAEIGDKADVEEPHDDYSRALDVLTAELALAAKGIQTLRFVLGEVRAANGNILASFNVTAPYDPSADQAGKEEPVVSA